MSRTLILLTGLISLLYPFQAAHASFWIECKVTVVVERVSDHAGDEANVTVKITDAVITDGHATSGEPCMDNRKSAYEDISLKTREALSGGETVTLKYEFYNAMGSDGVINETTWTIWPQGSAGLPWQN